MADLPTSTVTFLFTDVEGSTKLWERYPEAMRANMARHDEVLHGVMESSGGFVFKTIGDAFCVAFPSAPHALEAALAARRALLSEELGKTGPCGCGWRCIRDRPTRGVEITSGLP